MNNELIHNLKSYSDELRKIRTLLMGVDTSIAAVGEAMNALADRMELAATRALWAQSQDDSRKF